MLGRMARGDPDIEDPSVLARAEAELLEGEAPEARKGARWPWVLIGIGMLWVGYVGARGLLAQRMPSGNDVVGTYDFTAPAEPAVDVHADDRDDALDGLISSKRCEAILRLDAEGTGRVAWSELRGRPDLEDPAAVDIQWVLEGRVVTFVRVGRGSPCTGVLARYWLVDLSGPVTRLRAHATAPPVRGHRRVEPRAQGPANHTRSHGRSSYARELAQRASRQRKARWDPHAWRVGGAEGRERLGGVGTSPPTARGPAEPAVARADESARECGNDGATRASSR